MLASINHPSGGIRVSAGGQEEGCGPYERSVTAEEQSRTGIGHGELVATKRAPMSLTARSCRCASA